jgi:hypothetical protein
LGVIAQSQNGCVECCPNALPDEIPERKTARVKTTGNDRILPGMGALLAGHPKGERGVRF